MGGGLTSYYCRPVHTQKEAGYEEGNLVVVPGGSRSLDRGETIPEGIPVSTFKPYIGYISLSIEGLKGGD